LRAFVIVVTFLCGINAHAQVKDLHTSPAHIYKGIDSLINSKHFEEATVQLKNILKQEKAAHHVLNMAKGYALLGNILLMQRNPDKALENYLLSLNNYDLKKDTIELNKLYTNIGTLYSMLKDLSKAKEYYLKSLSGNKNKNLDRLKTLTNLAGVYAESGEKEYAFKTFREGIQLAGELNNLPLEAVLRTNLSNYFIEEKDWKKAMINARTSIAIRKKLKQPASVITLNNLGYALVQSGQLREGITSYFTALKTANAQEKQQIYYNLYQAQKSQGNISKSLNYLERYGQVKDSLAKLNYEQKVAQISAGYESLKKENRINNLEKENILQKKQLRQQLYLICAVLLITLLVSIVIYMRFKNYKIKDALEKSQIKRQLLLLQLNPHFIFNALQSVQRFIYLRDQEQSMQYLSSFSRLIRLTLENSDKDLIPLDEEIEILDHYLRLQRLNHDPAFSYEISSSKDIEMENIEIPVMLLQPFVENAVVHGIKDMQEGKIKIDISRQADRLHIMIMDNGSGRALDITESNNKLHRSMGMDILNQRILEFNRENNNYIELVVKNRQDLTYTGTSVHLSIAI
jgi:two-component sensor histidine kinase